MFFLCRLLRDYPDAGVLLTGDFNFLQISQFWLNLNAYNKVKSRVVKVKEPTRTYKTKSFWASFRQPCLCNTQLQLCNYMASYVLWMAVENKLIFEQTVLLCTVKISSSDRFRITPYFKTLVAKRGRAFTRGYRTLYRSWGTELIECVLCAQYFLDKKNLIKKLALRGIRPSLHFAQNGPIALKIPWTLSPLDRNLTMVIRHSGGRIWKLFAALVIKKLAPRGIRPSLHFAQSGPMALKIPSTLSPLDMSMYTEFGLVSKDVNEITK